MSPYELLIAVCGDNWIVAHIVTNVMIGLAYVAIPLVIVTYLRKRPDIEHTWVFWSFTAFIFGCGLGHFAHVLALWDARLYGLSMAVDAFTAAVSALTAVALWYSLPFFAQIPTPRQLLTTLRERDEAVGQLHQHKEILVKELNHRVRNNLQILQSLVSMMMRDERNASIPAEQLLGTILNRIMAVSRVHDRIYSDGLDMGRIDAKEFVGTICADLGLQFDADIETDVESMTMSVDESVPVAMIVNELVTNAVKYGKREGERAKVTVSLKRCGQDSWRLCVGDNGPGVDPNAARGNSIGMRLIRRLSSQLGGTLEIASTAEGSRFSVAGIKVA